MQHPTQLAREPSGNAKEVSWFRTVLKNIRERGVKVGPGLRASYKVDGTLIELIQKSDTQAAVEAAASVTMFKIISASNDHIVASEWDGVTSGTQRNIAKPHRLRKTPFHGISVTYGSTVVSYSYLTDANFRTATVTSANPIVVENQRVISPYQADAIIYATEPVNGTGVTLDGAALTWLDLNVDGRAWARY